MADHDALYHRFFGHPGMVEQLLRDFVAGPWIDDLDLSAMERVNARFHSDDGDRRDGDVVWRIPMRDGADAYVMLLLEFQSTPDRWMALRVMVYVGLLWQHLVREKRLPADGRLPPVLPPVLPIVVFNGDPRWAMPLSLRDLIGLPAASPFWHWQPEMRYHVIDEGAYPAHDLAARESLVALLFRMEHCHDPSQILPLVDAAIAWFKGHPGFEPLMSAFAMLAGRLMEMVDGAGPAVTVTENLQEARTMLATRAEEWKQQWMLQGMQQGMRQGMQKGEAVLLRRLLQRRFGDLPGWVDEHLASADTNTLEEWGLRVLSAGSIEDVFH